MSAAKKTPGLISLQVKGGRPPALSRKEWNTVAGILNNIQILCPQTDGQTAMGPKYADVKIGDSGLFITMPPMLNPLSPVANGSGSVIPFIGSGAPGVGTLSSSYTYVSSQPASLYVDITNLFLYVCTTTGTNSTSVWKIIGNTGTTQTFQVVSDGGDYYNCNTWDGSSAGATIIKVAKSQDLRCITAAGGGAWASKVIRGVTYTYTYSAVTGSTTDGVNVVEYSRAVSGSDGSAETDLVTPALNIGDIISAFSTTFAGPSGLTSVLWQAFADGRAWAAETI